MAKDDVVIEAPKKPRRKTKVWQDEERGDWRFEVVQGSANCTGAEFTSEKAAKDAAKEVFFGPVDEPIDVAAVIDDA